MQLSIMRLTSPEAPSTVELRLVGSIDVGTRQALLDAAASALSAADALTIDAGGVDFVDSVGIGALIMIGQMAQRARVDFRISRQSVQLERVLRIVGLDSHWHQTALTADAPIGVDR